MDAHRQLAHPGAAPHAMTRRAVLRAALAVPAAVALAACTSPPTETTSTATTPETTPMNPAPRTDVLLAYFSRAGENYWNGGRRDLEVGNTERLAKMISDRIGCDVYRIEATDPYPHDYDETVARNIREQDDDARPALAGALPDTSRYSTVILASPIWNVRPPMIMSTFAESVPLAGVTVLPVTTHAMSGLGRAVAVYTAIAPAATIGEGLAVRGEEVDGAGADVDCWLATTSLISRSEGRPG